jgi:hypothetical protein
MDAELIRYALENGVHALKDDTKVFRVFIETNFGRYQMVAFGPNEDDFLGPEKCDVVPVSVYSWDGTDPIITIAM